MLIDRPQVLIALQSRDGPRRRGNVELAFAIAELFLELGDAVDEAPTPLQIVDRQRLQLETFRMRSMLAARALRRPGRLDEAHAPDRRKTSKYWSGRRDSNSRPPVATNCQQLSTSV